MQSAAATVIKQHGWTRSWAIACDGSVYLVEYRPWGLNKESVVVDHTVVVERSHSFLMSHGYLFPLGDHVAALSVALPWWSEVLPLPHLSYVRLEVGGVVVHEEGRPPARPLKWSSAPQGFPVIIGR